MLLLRSLGGSVMVAKLTTDPDAASLRGESGEGKFANCGE
jgi:hypothetical protein